MKAAQVLTQFQTLTASEQAAFFSTVANDESMPAAVREIAAEGFADLVCADDGEDCLRAGYAC